MAQLGLSESFKQRQGWFATRSSAVFPARLRPDTDVLLTFLNYWKLKNHINSVSCILRVYDDRGTLAFRSADTVVHPHNQYSIRELLGQGDFDGMVEIEIVSTENLRFPFPAVQAFYRSGRYYSSVHSAGRIKNPDERQNPDFSIETNWSCKFSSGVTPFFHVFNGPVKAGGVPIEVAILSPDCSEIARTRIEVPSPQPFASQLLTIDEIFSQLNSPPAGSFVTVTLPSGSIFPRLVVGNLHRHLDFLEVTHSFPWSRSDDFVDVSRMDTHPAIRSLIPALQPPGLHLNLVSFPTNCAATVQTRVREQLDGESSLTEPKLGAVWTTGGAKARSFEYAPREAVRLASLDLVSERIPSRLNASYRYRVSGIDSPFSTDIATGAKSCVYPPKHTHWGPALIGDGLDTVLMFRNMSHDPQRTLPAKGELILYFADGKILNHNMEIPAEAAEFVSLGALDVSSRNPQLLSWMAQFDAPSVETFWTSWAPDGRICGDHSF